MDVATLWARVIVAWFGVLLIWLFVFYGTWREDRQFDNEREYERLKDAGKDVHKGAYKSLSLRTYFRESYADYRAQQEHKREIARVVRETTDD